MDTFDYVNKLSQEVGATASAYLRTDPTAQTMLNVSRSIAGTVAPLWPAVQAAFMVEDVVSFTFDVTAPPVDLLGVVTDLARSAAELGDILPSFDQLSNMGADAMQAYNDAIDGISDMIRSAFMKESAIPLYASMEGPVLKQADETPEAKWKETARADQEQREQVQLDADSRVAGQPEATLQKDAEFREAEAREKGEQERQIAEQKGEQERQVAEQERQAAQQNAEQERQAAGQQVEQEPSVRRESVDQEAERLAEERRRAIEHAREAAEHALEAQRAAREAQQREL